MKKLINRPEDVLQEMLDGLLAIYPGISRLAGHPVLLRSDAETVRDRQVALISGGGSGHEPAHAGYIGVGMLSAAVAGEVFTSPSTESVLAAIRAVTGKLGALLIVKNYTGDRLNFGLAAEIARSEGFLVESVTVSDDVALARAQDHAGRRGLAGTVLVHKIAGAAAAAALDLPQVASVAQTVADNLGTMGVALAAGTAPSFDKPAWQLDDEVELGLGIHGEPGIRKVPFAPADSLTDQLLHEIAFVMGLSSNERIVALVNNLGATMPMELAIVARRTLAVLDSQGLGVERLYAGTFLSSLDMAGVSITVLRINNDLLKWLDAPTSAPAWPTVLRQPLRPPAERVLDFTQPILSGEEPAAPEAQLQTDTGRRAERAIVAACAALYDAEHNLTELDQAVGDGDLGHNLSRAAHAIENALPSLDLNHPPGLLKQLGLLLEKTLGGSSGPLYGVLFLRTGSALEVGSANPARVDARLWAAALLDGCYSLSDLGGARAGDRTMLDALIPFAQTLARELAAGFSEDDALRNAAVAARHEAERTARMKPRRGRASYLGERAVGTPDPGAIAVAIWLEAAVRAIR